MKKTNGIMAVLVMTLTAFLVSCSNETFRELVGVRDSGNIVSFQLDNSKKGKTRATADGAVTTLAGFDRENSINLDKLYAVVFKLKDDGVTYEWFKTFDHSDITESTGTYSFDMGTGGVFYMYIIANAEADLKALDFNSIATANSITTREALYQQLEVLDGSGKIASGKKYNEATDFLMTSKQIQVNIKGEADTDLSTIELTRVFARIDVDASALPDDFEITQISFINRYNKTYLIRGAKGNNMTDANLTKDDSSSPKVYAAADVKIEADPTDYENTTANVWNGVIYSCENYDTSDGARTVLIIEGEYTSGLRDGITVSHEIPFESMAVKRNYIYKVKLTLEDEAEEEYGKVSHTISVKDWSDGAIIAWAGDENLYNNNAAASYTITETVNHWNVTVEGNTIERHLVLPYNTEKSATFYVESTSTRSGLNLTCPATALAATEDDGGYQCTIGTPTVTYYENGEFTQKWPVTVRQSAFAGGNILTFTLQNALNSLYSANFQVTGVEPNIPAFKLLANGATGSSTSINVKANKANNPEVIYCRPTNGTISLEVKTKGGAILAIDDDSQWTETEDNVTLSGATLDTDNETFIQNVTFQLSTIRGKKTTFTLKNAADPDNTSLWRTFTLDAFKTPLEYMAAGNVKYITKQSGYWILDQELHTYSAAYFTWADATTNFGVDNGSGINTKSDVLCKYSDGSGIGYYHLPTRYEWFGIIPESNMIFQMTTTPSEETDSKVVISSAVLSNCKSQYVKNSSNNYVVYALKCMNDPVYGNLFRCAYRFTYIAGSSSDSYRTQRYTFECIYIGENNSITSVNNVAASYWASNASSAVIRTLPCASYSNVGTTNNKNSPSAGAPNNPGYYTSIATATAYDSNRSYFINMAIGPSLQCVYDSYVKYGAGASYTQGVSARLWSNE